MTANSRWHVGLGRRRVLATGTLAAAGHLIGCNGMGGLAAGGEMTLPLTDPERPPSRGPFTGGLVQAIAWSPDGRRLAASAEGIRPLHLWDAATGAVVARVPRGQTTSNAVAFTRDGRHLLATLQKQPIGQGTYAFSVLDAATGAEMQEVRDGLSPGAGGGAQRLALSPDGRWAAAMFDPNHVAVYATDGWAVVGGFGLGRWFIGRGLAFSPDGERLAVVGFRGGGTPNPARGRLEVWSWRTGERVLEVPVFPHGLSAVAWQPGGEAVAVATGGRVTVLPDGRSAPFEDRVVLLDARTGERRQVWRWATDEASAEALDWAPDGRRLAVAADGRDGVVRVVMPGSEAAAGVGARTARAACHAVAFAPDGQRVAFGNVSAVRVAGL